MMGLAEDVKAWRDSQPDLIQGKSGQNPCLLTRRACLEYLRSGRQKYKYHLNLGHDPEEFKNESWANGYVLCKDCEHFTLVYDPPRNANRTQRTQHGYERDRVDRPRQNSNLRKLQAARLATPELRKHK